jgi:hypothetical protein
VSGLRWLWPHVAQMVFSVDLLVGLGWLIIGAAAWVVALNFGLQRYWRRRPGRS